jgi:CheY-like chemotaxis protein
MLPRVFDMFAQVDGHSERAQGGLGIGLALVKQLVAMHGGEVWAHSDGPGQGSEFTVRLPLAEAGAANTERIEAHKLEAGVEQGVRVLIVDDNIDSALTMAQVLDMLGYETRTVHDGLEAVDAAQAFAPDVVVLDIGLPHISGHEAARRIRQLPGGRGHDAGGLERLGQEDDLRKSAAAGFDRHFVKPVDLHALMEVVALARRPLGQAVFRRVRAAWVGGFRLRAHPPYESRALQFGRVRVSAKPNPTDRSYQRSAGVCTGASHSAFSSSFSSVTVSEAPAISSDVV